jgi:hypothetical protein
MSKLMSEENGCNGNGSTGRRKVKIVEVGRGDQRRAIVEATEKPRGTWKQFMRSDQPGAVTIMTHILFSFSRPPLLYPSLSPSISSWTPR